MCLPIRNWLLSVSGAFAAVFSTVNAYAADDPPGLSSQAPASTGVTEVAKTGFKRAETAPEEVQDSTSASVMAGALASSGNSRSISATAAGDARILRSNNQFSSAAAVNYGRSAAGPEEPMVETIKNFQGRLRYDRFLNQDFAAFFGVSARRDTLQELEVRLNLDPGLAYYLASEKELKLWVELGYDAQFDRNARGAIRDGAKVSEWLHNARAFAGYTHDLSTEVSLSTGLEYLQNVSTLDRYRLNWDFAITSALRQSFSVATTLSVKYDNQPLPGVFGTDFVTALNLVYKLK